MTEIFHKRYTWDECYTYTRKTEIGTQTGGRIISNQERYDATQINFCHWSIGWW